MKVISIIHLFVLSLLLINVAYAQNDNIIQQKSNVERYYKTTDISSLASIYLSDYEFYRTELFSITAGKELVFYDFNKKNLFKSSSITNTGELFIHAIGDGVGSGPGEFRNPTDLCITETIKGEKIVIIDPVLSRVSIWNANTGELENSFRSKDVIPFRVSCSSGKIVIYNSSFSKKGNYAVYDLDGELISFIKDPTQDINSDSFIESGYITMDDTLFFYSGSGNNFIKSFSHVSNEFKGVKLHVGTMENQNKVEVIVEDKSVSRKRGEDYIFHSSGLGLYKDKLIVLYSGREDAYSDVLDIYDKFDLTYLFSIKINDLANTLVVKNNLLILKVWDWQREEAFIKIFDISKIFNNE